MSRFTCAHPNKVFGTCSVRRLTGPKLLFSKQEQGAVLFENVRQHTMGKIIARHVAEVVAESISSTVLFAITIWMLADICTTSCPSLTLRDSRVRGRR